MEISDGRKQKRGEGGNFIGTGGRGSRRGQELARGARQHDLSAAQQGCGGGGDQPVGPSTAQCRFFNYSNIFQTDLNLNLSKDGLLLLKNFQTKYWLVEN
jgi:hypothetical protein